ncbi:hypothetical protein RSO41_13310 [Halomonas sp. I1]|uniref:hypothetical protein n=1 Tax=Halomonas sp. I1 TaxID=393536 RepID=UPI0028DEF2C8|nr:hypothetical protein [Halomonas sp. I1]MDT8895630.1 hypothetical protein [Halomonas sp. I1]
MSRLNVATFSDLAAATAAHLAEADHVADSAQERMASPTKQGLHKAKSDEATGSGQPRPLLEAEAEALGESVDAVASRVLEQRKKYAAKCAKIEAARIKARADIRAVTSPAEQKRIVNRLSADLLS